MSSTLSLNNLFHIPDAHHKSLSSTFVGIDFGTSTTVVSIAAYDIASRQIICTTLHLPQKDQCGAEMYGELFPTVIAVNNVNGKPIYGQGAYDLKWHSDYVFGVNLWHSFKMELGKDLGPRWYNSMQSKIKSPQDATALFFKFLKRSIERVVKEQGLPSTVKYAVSIPASFESNQRKDLMEALRQNDIEIDNSLFIDEPNAAFLAYINSFEADPIKLKSGYNPKVLVFDFGAGTCDISILEITADHQGLHSKNISISEFAELGGNDIDRYIARNYLLPQLLKHNSLYGKDCPFTEKEKEAVATQLLPIAENMKKRLCSQHFDFMFSDPQVMEQLVNQTHGLEVDNPKKQISVHNHELTKDTFWLSYKDFSDTMNVFFRHRLHFFQLTTKADNEPKYNSIHEAVNSALKKAHIDKKEVDYVIMVGGSSRNPFVQHRIKEMFKDSTVMIPRDLQGLVSKGAALHSILANGIGIQAVRPIVGESIMVVTQYENRVVIPAGTQVPFATTIRNVFTTGSNTYSKIEIPICVGSPKKMLHNLVLVRDNGACFPPHTDIELCFEMDSNKILHAKARGMDEEWEAVCENPLDNIAMTDSESCVMKAQRECYISAEKNGSQPTVESLKNLSRAYEDNNQPFLAAETLEELLFNYPNCNLNNRIGVLFHNSGNYNRAVAYYRKAFELEPTNATICGNLGHTLSLLGENDEARKYLEKAVELRGDSAIAVAKLADLEYAEDNTEKANALYKRAFNLFKREWIKGNLDNCLKGWFASVADSIGEEDICRQVRAEIRNSSESQSYSRDNTLFTTDNPFIQ